jgi:hypothetical protein
MNNLGIMTKIHQATRAWLVFVCALVSLTHPVSAGVLLRLGYGNLTAIPGPNISDLTNNPAFPNSPDANDVLTGGIVIPMNIANDYGSWVRGFIEAPQTGAYTFWVAGVDSGEFWLSPNENPAGKVLIAHNGVTTGMGPNDWFLIPAQKSAPVSLVQGQKYYFEMLHKEDSLGTWDSCSAAWTLPDGTFQGPVPSTNVWPFPVDLSNPAYPPVTSAPQVLTDYNGIPVDVLAPQLVLTEGTSADLTVTAQASQPASVQWFSNNVAIPGAVLLNYHIPVVTMALNGAVYKVTIQNGQGQTSTSTTLSVQPDTTPFALVDALSLANTAGDVAVVFSRPVDPATATTVGNYSFTPTVAIAGARIGATPNTVLLQTPGLAVGIAYSVKVNNVRDRASTPNIIPANSSMPVEQDLAAWYRLDESTGTVAADSSGHALNGTLMLDAYPGYAGKVLKSTKMEGVTGGYVALPPGFSDFTTNGFTVSLWAYPTTEGSRAVWSRFIDFANGAGNNNILFAHTGDENDVTFEVYVGGASGGKVTTPWGTLIVNQWQHWAATLDALGNAFVYKNGQRVASGTTGIPSIITRNNNYLGLSNWGTDGHYAGGMDDVRIYNRVLDPAAISALASGGGQDDTDPSQPVVSAVATVATTALKSAPPGVFTITRTGSTTAALTVQYALSGTATNGVAYNALSGSVVIPAGTNSAQVLVTPKDFSFQGSQQTVILTVVGSTNYAIALADGGTVTILNNDVGPAAIQATTDNGLSGGAITVDVWFASSVTTPSATTVANYTLVNAPGVSISGATLGNHNLRVVLTVSGTIPAGAQISVHGVQDPGGNTVAAQIPIRQRLAPVNLVADIYHSPDNNRPLCFALATDGVVVDNNGAAGFDTWQGGGQPSEFVGLIYDHNQDFEVVRVDLGNQFGDGGSWAVQPKVYVLKNPVDSNTTRPETDPKDWAEVPAKLISGSQFHTTMDIPSPETPIVFDLSGLTAAQRNGYGWAVGGVKGSGTADFISVSEVASYGTAGNTLAIAFTSQPSNVTVSAGQRVKFTAVAGSTIPLTYQWLREGQVINDATNSALAYGPVLLTDSNTHYELQVTMGSFGTSNSQPATLTVVPRSAPPVLAATYDPSNLVVEVWFNGSVDPTTAQTVGNYSISDTSVSISVAAQEAQGCGVNLTLSGPLSAASPTVTVSNVHDLDGQTMASTTTPILPLVSGATNVVANAYQQGRAAALTRSTDGIVVNDANITTWTTYGSPAGTTDFVGVGYAQPQVFGVVKVDLGYQYGDGGDWGYAPQVFILKNPVDTNQKFPETDPADWVPVPATLLSDNIFDLQPDAPANTVPPPNTPIAFDLSHLPLAQRTGYGWALGGVQGNGPVAQFVSIAEARAFGVPASTVASVTGAPQILIDTTPRTVLIPPGFPFALSVPMVVGSAPLHFQWQINGLNLIDDARGTGSQTSTLSVSSALMADTGSYRLIVTNSFGAVTSAVAQVTVTPTIGFGGNGAGWVINSYGTIVPMTNNVLTLVAGGLNEARSAWVGSPQYIGAFKAAFTYQDVGGGGADGAVFALQNSEMGSAALGGGGGGLGFAGITPSAGLEFNVYSPNTVGIAFRPNGTTGGPYTSATPVNLASGNPIAATVEYDGTTAWLTLTDTVTHATFSANFAANLPSMVGGNAAYVGFTGASGGVASFQQISNFTFANRPILTIQSTPGSAPQAFWPRFAGAYTLEKSTDLKTWTSAGVTGTLVNGQYVATLPTSTGNLFFRLVHP